MIWRQKGTVFSRIGRSWWNEGDWRIRAEPLKSPYKTRADETVPSIELRNRDHTSTKRILYSRLLFQGSGLPPSNAVDPTSSPSQGGFYPALRGRTRFAFKFDLPKNLPSTANFGANGVVRYELRAFASSLFEGDVDLKSEKKDVLVVERWDDWRKGNWTTGSEKTAEQEVKGREGGLVSMKASIGTDEASGTLPRLFWWRDVDEGVEGKGSIEVRVRMKNTTKRHVSLLFLCRSPLRY